MVQSPPKKTIHYDTTDAIAQTKQQFPDYMYYFNKKTNMWRYYDLKTGQLQINSGHVVGIADVEQYENVVQYLIIHPLKLYAHKPSLALFIKNLCDDSTLSWSERNQRLQQYSRGGHKT